MIPQHIDTELSKDLGSLWHELRGGLWHRTASHRFRQIHAAGKIDPNPVLDAREWLWATANGGTTCCRAMNGVSLFDFGEADWKQAFEADGEPWRAWSAFLMAPEREIPADKWTATIWLQLARSQLSGLVPVPEVSARRKAMLVEVACMQKWMDGIEACHIGAIPLAACTKALVVCAVETNEFQILDAPIDVSAIDHIESHWRERFAKGYLIRSLPLHEAIKHIDWSSFERPTGRPTEDELHTRLQEARARLADKGN